jgi:hypothetical protein
MKLEAGEKLLDYLPAEIMYKYDFGDGENVIAKVWNGTWFW